MFSTIVLASLIAAQQQSNTQPKANFDYNKMHGSIESLDEITLGESLTMIVKVRDIDVRVLVDIKTGKHHAESYEAAGTQEIFVDPELHAGGISERVKSVTGIVEQSDISVRKIGWDKKKEWFTYEVTVTANSEKYAQAKTLVVPIEIRDNSLFEWNRDGSLYLGKALTIITNN